MNTDSICLYCFKKQDYKYTGIVAEITNMAPTDKNTTEERTEYLLQMRHIRMDVPLSEHKKSEATLKDQDKLGTAVDKNVPFSSKL